MFPNELGMLRRTAELTAQFTKSDRWLLIWKGLKWFFLWTLRAGSWDSSMPNISVLHNQDTLIITFVSDRILGCVIC